MSRARSVADLGNQNVLTVSATDGNINVGTGVTIENTGEAQFSGIVTATGGDFSGNVSVGGVLTYEDVTSVDSVGIITARSDVSIADSIFHIGDGDTAIRFPAADTFTVETAGSEKLRITSGGNVGIGTDNPGTSLEVFTDDDTDISDNTGTNNANSILRLYNKNGSDGTGVNNYTGIRFDVASGATSSAYLNYVRTGDNQGEFLFKARNAASSYPELLRIDSSSNVAINYTGTLSSKLTLSIGNVTNRGKWSDCEIALDNPTNVGAYSQIGMGYVLNSTYAPAYMGFLSTNQATFGYGDIVFGTRNVSTDTQPTERMRIDSSGNVKLFDPDTTFANAKSLSNYLGIADNYAPGMIMKVPDLYSGEWSFYLASSASVTDFVIADDNNERMRIDSSGRMLLGATSTLPAGTQLQVEGSGYYEGGASLRRNSNDTGGTALRICKSRGTSDGSFTPVVSGDTLGLVQFCGADGNSDETGAEIRCEVDGSVGNGNMPARLLFSTNNGAQDAAPTERMRIDSSGTVQITMGGSGYATLLRYGTNEDNYIRSGVNGITAFGDHNGGERMRIDSSGNVVLKPTNPAGVSGAYSNFLGFRVTQTNNQSALLGTIKGQGQSSWGGDLVFSTKPNNGTPNDSVTERIRITNSGDFQIPTLTGTSNTIQVGQRIIGTAQDGNGSRQAGIAIIRTGGTGGGITSGVGIGFYTSSNTFAGYSQTYSDSLAWYIYGHGHFVPGIDNHNDIGGANNRCAVIYATTGTINTSDINEKQDIRDLEQAELEVAKEIKTLIKAYRWVDSVNEKGDDARIHVGVIAQEVEEVFSRHELDVSRYGLWCSDTWYELDGQKVFPDEDGNYPEGAIERTRMGVRYDQLLAFVIAAL